MKFEDALVIDLETYSEVDLNSQGLFKYVDDPSFEIILCSYGFVGDTEVTTIDLAQGESLPNDLIGALTNPSWKKIAHNATFERTCLAKYLKTDMPPEQWLDTAVLSVIMGYPRSLAQVGEAMGLDNDKKKETTGKALIKYFSCPCTPTSANGGRTRNKPKDNPERWELYKKYNKQDVVAETEILLRILDEHRQMPVDLQYPIWCLDQRINEKGVLIDSELVNNAINYAEQMNTVLVERAKEISDIDNPNSNQQIQKWLKEKGVETSKVDKKTRAQIIAQTEDTEIEEFLRIKDTTNKSSISKYSAMDRACCSDGRIYGLMLFYGTLTGRWSSKIVQLQNLPRNTEKTLADARELVKSGDFEMLELLYSKPMDILSQLIRTALIAKPGYIFCVADFSAIECRVLAWLAQEDWKNEVFAGEGKIYEATAAKMFGVPMHLINKDNPMRGKGKVAELACGYAGGPVALKAAGAGEMGLTEFEMRELVTAWRKASPRTVSFWSQIEGACRRTTEVNGRLQLNGLILEYNPKTKALYIQLPSGRDIVYRKFKASPKYSEGLSYWGLDDRNQWSEIRTYGGKLTENITSGIARDCLVETMLSLFRSFGYIPSFHVHDELIIEVPIEEADLTLERMKKAMSESAPWCPGLRLTAEAYKTEYYLKD